MTIFPLSYTILWRLCEKNPDHSICIISQFEKSSVYVIYRMSSRAFFKLFMIVFEHPLCLPDDYEDLTSHLQNITTGAFSTYRVWLLDYSDVWYWQNNFDR